jgi:hypothetical protein
MRSAGLLLILALATSAVLATPGDPEPPATGSAELAFRDIRGPLPIDGPPPFAVTGGVLLLAGGLFLVVRRAHRVRRGAPLPPCEPRPDPKAQLAELADAHRRGACPDDILIVRLDALVRDLLATTTGIPARCLTSAELTRAFTPAEAASGAQAFARSGSAAEVASATGRSLGVGSSPGSALGPLLALGDRVKFAGHRPGTVEVDDALRTAGRLVDGLSAGSAR